MQGDEGAATKLHNTLAALICKCQGAEGLLAASEHFSRGDDPGAFAAYLSEVSRKGSHSEQDLLITRAILQVLLPPLNPLGRCLLPVELSNVYHSKECCNHSQGASK